jgi:phosphatidyl-myo-inositol dimannoside synthase
VRPLRWRTGFHTLDRWLYNAGVALSPPRDADLVLGIDLDGFLWARRRRLPFVASLKGIIADELKNERGWVRRLLAV